MSLVFFGGRLLGSLCIKKLLESDLRPDLVVINPEDKGLDTAGFESTLKLAKSFRLNVIPFKEFILLPDDYFTEKLQPTVGFSAYCSRLIPERIIQKFEIGITNIHFSLLPYYRGQFPTVYAIFDGRSETGVTLHWINEKADLGDIIEQRKILILEDDTGYTLYNKCVEEGVKIFQSQLSYFQKKEWPLTRKQILDADNINSFYKVLPNNGEIDWSWDGKKIKNFLRASYFPGYDLPKIEFANKSFKIIEL